MAWVRIDDQAPRHKKMLRAGPAACWLWVCGIAHCQSQLTDGFIPTEAVPLLGVTKGVKPLLDKLVEVGLFEVTDGGYRVHDYHDYNASRDQAIERRDEIHDAKSRAGRLGGLRSGEARRLKQNGSSVLEAGVKQDA